MRVLMVSGRLPSSSKPGSQSFITRQIDSLRPYCSRIDIHEVVGNKFFKHLKSARHIARVSSNYDIIHVHYGLFAVAGILGKKKTPLVLSLMGSDIFGTPDKNGKITIATALEARLSRYLAKHCNRVIVKTKEMADQIPTVHTDVIPNGVDLDVFYERPMQECRQHLGWDPNSYYILFPGNPARPEKNWDLASDSVEKVSKQICGNVYLVPLHNVIPSDVPVFINASNMILMTSYSEGSPNVVKEALACNKPVISVDVGDVVITIGNIGGCSIVEYDSSMIGEEIVSKLGYGSSILEGRGRLWELSLDIDSVANNIMTVYNDLLGCAR